MINLTAKKVYCPNCKKLVRVKKQAIGEKTQYNCIKCEKMVWQKENIKWKAVKS